MKVANTVPKSGALPLHSCKPNKVLLPKVARRFPRVGSTNQALLDAIEQDRDLPSGTVFLADAQTAGRGQGRNVWHSSPHANLTFSMLLRPDQLAVQWIYALTRVTSLALIDAVRNLLPESDHAGLSIKWPNDIYHRHRKLAGILIQNGLRGDRVQWSVAGVGLNVNETDFPPELAQFATSLRLITGTTWDREAVLTAVLDALPARWTQLQQHEHAALDRDYHRYLYGLDREVWLLRPGAPDPFRATVRGVDDSGRLRLEHPDGRPELCELRSIRWVRPVED